MADNTSEVRHVRQRGATSIASLTREALEWRDLAQEWKRKHDVLEARNAELETKLKEATKWISEAVASCAKKRCSLIERGDG